MKKNYLQLQHCLRSGELEQLQTRFNVWRFLLRSLPTEVTFEELSDRVAQQRKFYYDALDNFKKVLL
jgi:hypothetical protein